MSSRNFFVSLRVLMTSCFIVAFSSAAAFSQTAPAKVDLKFAFFTDSTPFEYTQVVPTDAYTADKSYGFDLGSKVVPVSPFAVTGLNDKPFFFSTKLAPGAYQVKVTLGDSSADSITTVKSETRRLMLEAVYARRDLRQPKTYSFLVHIRVPQIPGTNQSVALKPRERDPILFIHWNDQTEDLPFTELDWDEKLTLEFSGTHPAVSRIEITNAENPTTIYLIGDSTMTDHFEEPWAVWGQQFPRWFKEPVLIANYAECGETTASFIGERRWPKILSEIHAGDYVLMQFGINDRSIPLDRFKQYFVTFINDTKAHGAHPILVTSQNLRRLGPDGKGVQTLGGYPDAMREVAKEQDVPLIDLNAMSMKLYEAIGPEKLPKAFIDGTHHSAYGAYELSKCVVQGLIDAKIPFAEHVVADWKPFDPAHPDSLEDFHLPADPQLDPARPGGPGHPGLGAMAAPIAPGRGARGTTQPATQPARP